MMEQFFIQLLDNGRPTQLLAAPVPESAIGFEIVNTSRKEVRFMYDDNSIEGKHSAIWLKGFSTLDSVRILGTLTVKSIGFDVSQYIEADDTEEYLYGLLKSNGIHLWNPCGVYRPECPMFPTKEAIAAYSIQEARWDIAQEQICKKVLILKHMI